MKRPFFLWPGRERVESARDALAAYALRRDTVLLEYIMALAALYNACTVFAVGRDGRPLAPFLSSALRYLSFGKPLWAASLAALGVLSLVCIAVSTRGSKYFLPRAVVAGIQCAVYAAIVVAILTSEPPHTVASVGRYAIASHAMFLTAYVLALQYWKERQGHSSPAPPQVADPALAQWLAARQIGTAHGQAREGTPDALR